MAPSLLLAFLFIAPSETPLPAAFPAAAAPAVLDPDRLLAVQTFWDNRDFDWFKRNIPFFDCPDPKLVETWHYRWELVTKHLVYGSPDDGYAFTEFIDRPFWSGTYGAISCPAGHQLYEVRWLKDPRFARDFARYWFRVPGAQPRNYSTWLADAVWAVHQAHPSDALLVDLLPDLVKNYEGWVKRHFVPAVGLFWQTGHDDGMEFNINSRQTQDLVRGSPGFRTTLNAYLYADALAIARVADLAKKPKLAADYRAKAAALKKNVQARLWDPQREFFFHVTRDEEHQAGVVVRAGTKTYESGRFAGSPFGRELYNYVPWQFGMVDPAHDVAWKFLMDPARFAAPFGPTTVERQDPMFHLSKTCCWWSGQSWPYATAQTLKALANQLQSSREALVKKADYLSLLQTYARTHSKNGRPYLAEAAHPFTGSWEGHDSYNHSEHYFHSSFCDLVITGLVGVLPTAEGATLHPLAPETWDYFALDDLPCQGRRLAVVWDRTGAKYGRGQGLSVFLDGKRVHKQTDLSPAALRFDRREIKDAPPRANYAVNNSGAYYPRIRASSSGATKLIDGNYWYHLHPPNRWVAAGASEERIEIDFGAPRPIDELKLCFLEDESAVGPPASFDVLRFENEKWVPAVVRKRTPAAPAGRRANVLALEERPTRKLAFVFKPAPGRRTGLTEIEAWGPKPARVESPPPQGDLALNQGGKSHPKATASFTSPFDRPSEAIDGVIQFQPGPRNRWTSYGSPNDVDWLEIDLGAEKLVGRIELAIYDDRGGVRPPASLGVELWQADASDSGATNTGARKAGATNVSPGKTGAWKPAANAKHDPPAPAGSQLNEITFNPARTSKIRIHFRHRGVSRSGVTEVLIWER
ncbi:MAG TPA: glycosyl hydrolase family 65 protein [Planctomycetia bacterium]|nr:glycosyl hydrolase family 65 protein [Planctomycetia bacterium]